MGEKGLRRDAKDVAWQALQMRGFLPGYGEALYKYSADLQAHHNAAAKWGSEHVPFSQGDYDVWLRDHPLPSPPVPDQWTLTSELGFNSATGQNAAWDEDQGAWVDTKTGKPLTPPLVGK